MSKNKLLQFAAKNSNIFNINRLINWLESLFDRLLIGLGFYDRFQPPNYNYEGVSNFNY